MADRRVCAQLLCSRRFVVEGERLYCSSKCRDIEYMRRHNSENGNYEAWLAGCPSPWKLRHETRELAASALRDSLNAGYDKHSGLNVYRCNCDLHFHVGRRPHRRTRRKRR